MHLYRRKQQPDRPPNLRWYFKFVYRGRIVRRSTDTANRKNAERIAYAYRERHVQRANGVVLAEDVDVPAVRLEALEREYLEFAESDHPASADEDRRVCARFAEIVGGGETFIHQIDAAKIDGWRLQRRRDKTRKRTMVTAAAVNRELNIVRAMFRQAVTWKYLTASPCAGIQDFKTDGTPVRILTAEELERAFTRLPEPFNLFCEVTFYTLARLSEVANLRVEHVNVEHLADGRRIGILVKRVKGGVWKRVRIPLSLAERLRAQVTSDEQTQIFPAHCEDVARPPQRKRHRTSARRRRRAAGISAKFTILFRAIGLRCSHHAFRHSGITRMLEGGINPRAIQEHAGWANLKQLERYGRVLDQEFARAVEVTEDYMIRYRAAKAAIAEALGGENGGAA